MTKTIVITSGKGGVGKTNISVNTALELSKRNYRTCLFDADFGLANVDILLGLRPEFTLDDCIFGEKTLAEIIIRSKTGIDIIPGSSGIEKIANLAPDKITTLVSSFSELTDYDFFLIDTSSGISQSVISFCLACNETIVVITSEATSLIDAYSLVKVMAANGYTGTVKVLVNKCQDVPTSKQTYLRFKKAIDTHLNIDIAPAGIVLRDPHFETALKHQEPLLTLYPNSIGSQCIRSMVSILLNSNGNEGESVHFGEFWQRYFDCSPTSLAIPENFMDKANHPTKPSTADQPKEVEPSSLLSTTPENGIEILEEGQKHLLQRHEETAARITDVPVQPELIKTNSHPPGPNSPLSVTDDGLTIDMLNLPSPISLLSRCLDLQSKGALLQSDLFEIFSCDPTLMLKALTMVSSSTLRRPRRISSIRQILNEIGPGTLSNILTKTTTQEALAEPTEADTHFVNLFWHHSYKTAEIAQKIATAINYPYPEEAFLSGLLHDIGRLALQISSPELYMQAPLTFIADQQLLEEENRILGNNHAETGAASIRNLQLNSFIADAAQYHTESETTIRTAFDLVKIVFIASRLTEPTQTESAIHLGTSILQLSATELTDCIAHATETVERVADHFHISLSKEREAKNSAADRKLFKRQAVDYMLLQGILPTPEPARDRDQIIHRIHQGLHVLFGIKHALCLMPDEHSSYLQAVGYPDCFGEEILSDIVLSFASGRSVIVEAFSNNEMTCILENEAAKGLSLGDQQIISYLDSDGVACVPMVVDGESLGMIIFGIKKTDKDRVYKQKSKLQQFGTQSAKNIVVVEQVTRPGRDDTSSALQKNRNSRDDLLN